MAPLAPAPSSRPRIGPPTGPTDGAVGSRHHCLCRSRLPFCSVGQWHVCKCADAWSGRASCTTPCAASPLPLSLSSLSSRLRPRPPRALAGPLSAMVVSAFHSVLSLVCLSVLPSVSLLPLPSRSLPGTLHDTVRVSFTFLRVGHLVPVSGPCSPLVGRRRGILSPAADSPCARTRLRAPPLTFIGSGQSQCAQITSHAALHAPLLPFSLSSLVACPVRTLCPLAPLCSLSLSHARYTTRSPASLCASVLFAFARTVHCNPRGSPAPLLFVLLWPSVPPVPLSRPFFFPLLLCSLCPFIPPRAMSYTFSLCASAL